MVDFRRLSDRAKGLVEKRGGSESLKRDADELKNIARGPGSFKDKAKAAVDAIKDPGAPDQAVAEQAQKKAPPPPAETAEGGMNREGGAGGGHQRRREGRRENRDGGPGAA